MTKSLVLLLCVGMLGACGQSSKPEPKPAEPGDKVLYEAVKKPLDKAKSVEDTLQADKEKLDQAIEQQEQSNQ